MFTNSSSNLIISLLKTRTPRYIKSSLKIWNNALDYIITPFVESKTNYCIKRPEIYKMKLSSPEFQSILTDEVKLLHELFTKNGYQIRIAGGAVRDLLVGKIPQDLDFATTATPEQMRNMFTEQRIRTINSRGESHGTVTARINESNFEVTTLRIDAKTDGRHAIVEFTTNWFQDASRRDLTINAMFLDLDGTVYDYFNGYEDLKNRRVLFVGDASTRIQEDYLRILRYFRFYGRIAENPDDHRDDVLTAISDNKNGLSSISGERIHSELYKIVTGSHGVALLKKMLSLGLGPYIGLPAEYNFNELDRVELLMKEENVILDPISIISTLLSTEEEVEGLCKRLKVSSFHKQLALFIVEHRNAAKGQHLRYFQRIFILSQPMNMRPVIEEFLRCMGEMKTLQDFKDWNYRIKFPLSGVELMEETRKVTEDRRAVGFVKKNLINLWIDSDFKMTKTELFPYIPEMAKEYTPQVMPKNVGKKMNKRKHKDSI